MPQTSDPPAVTRWVIQQQVFLFYGNGGVFDAAGFERWFRDLEAASDLRLYVGAAGSTFSFGPGDRERATSYFKRRKLRFAVVTESVRLRLLGQTGRLVGMNLGLYSWGESKQPFVELGLSPSLVETLHGRLLELRQDVESELQQTGR